MTDHHDAEFAEFEQLIRLGADEPTLPSSLRRRTMQQVERTCQVDRWRERILGAVSLLAVVCGLCLSIRPLPSISHVLSLRSMTQILFEDGFHTTSPAVIELDAELMFEQDVQTLRERQLRWQPLTKPFPPHSL
ncbi:hypothetical protein [Thalassoroseus pseudoceratinae]|uniref:hypothetical protein n=1 Tax=Thalassoroseus pseudoceratinae TaxID=2713176 RepID=UPI001420A3FC|nr:hypothetical protein [Thalassoroseus pseudoceratinae]